MERMTRFTLLRDLPPLPGEGTGPREKTVPRLQVTVLRLFEMPLPDQFRALQAACAIHSWDPSAEMAQHAKLETDTRIRCSRDPQSLWHRGSNENTDGHCVSTFPTARISMYMTRIALDAVADIQNKRPLKKLRCKMPTDTLKEILS